MAFLVIYFFVPIWQDVVRPLGGNATHVENCIDGKFSDCLTEASRTLGCGFASFVLAPHL